MKSEFDRIDYEIIAALQNNCRQSNKELAAKVGLAPSSCHERVKRLEAQGILKGFHAQVKPLALGIGIQAIIAVRLRRHTRKFVEAFFDHCRNLVEVIGVYHVTGEHDFFVHVVLRDSEHLRKMAMDSFTTFSELANMQTSLVLSDFQRPCLPHLNRDV